MHYRAYQGEILLRKVWLPPRYYHLVFVRAVSASWSAKKKAAAEGMPHQQKPDKDNLEKALLDSLHNEDCHIWDGRVSKLWGKRDLIIVADQDLFTHDACLPIDLEPYYLMAPPYQ